MVRWLAWLALALLAGVLALYGVSEARIKQAYAIEPVVLRTDSHASSVTNGERLSLLLSCQGCHRDSGNTVLELPLVLRMVAPNLTRVTAEYSDAELGVLLRAGIKRDGTSAIFMPTASLAWLADQDLVDLIAWLRSLQPMPDGETTTMFLGVLPRIAMIRGVFPFSASQPTGRETPPVFSPNDSTEARGEYLYRVMCLHCHDLDAARELRPGVTTPALAVVAHAYPAEQFRTLLRTGAPVGGRKLTLMTNFATNASRHLEDDEIGALHTYLKAAAVGQGG